MPSPARPARPKRSPRQVARAAGRFIAGVGKRVYALALIALVLWLSGRALVYLVSTLLLAEPPPQIVQLPKRLDAELLTREAAGFEALVRTENPRTPLAHYHRVDGWFDPDPRNGCTTSGCHAPLPHAASKELRAFLNMHATSMHCGVCHMTTESPEPTLALCWYDLDSGEPVAPPPLLAAYGWLDERLRRLEAGETPQGQGSTDNPAQTAPAGQSAPAQEASPAAQTAPSGLAARVAQSAPAAQSPPARAFTRADQAEIVGLLAAATEAADGNPALANILRHCEAARPESDEFARILAYAYESLPRFFRGEYGAKLALRTPDGRPLLNHPGAETAQQRLLRLPADAPAEQRQRVIAAAHPRRAPQPRTCSDCHRPAGGLIDFAALGYPPPRIHALAEQPIVMEMIERIGRGHPFHLPSFIGQPPQER